jgi:molybdopterin molybdotransferase
MRMAYASALQRLLAHGTPQAAEGCAPADAQGRVLAAALHAPGPLPAFDNAAMDGYALPAVGEPAPAGSAYTLAGTLAAGDTAATATASTTQAWRIMTGAPLPAGFDRVVALEDTQSLGEAGMRVCRSVPSGCNVRHRGSDIATQEPLAAAGQRIDASLIMVLAALGMQSVQVRAMPRIAILSTGAELLADPSTALAPGQIHGASAPYLQAALRAFGAQVVMNHTLGDEPGVFLSRLAEAAEQCDVIVTTGAVSMGDHDFIPGLLPRAGAELIFHKVAMRPGKPVLAARLARGPVLIGLPGNPVASAVGFRFFVVPLLRALLGMPAERASPLALACPYAGSRSGLRQFLKARVEYDAGRGLRLQVLEGQQSFRLRSLLQANAWAIIEEDASVLAAGMPVDAVPLDPLQGWCPD